METLSKNAGFYLQSNIREYDISNCNVSVLREYDHIDDDTYNRFVNMDKKKRVVEIGLWIKKNSEYYGMIKKGVQEHIVKFVEENKINKKHIIEIAFDAVWLYSEYPKKTEFGYIKFANKREYTSLLKIGKYYIYQNSITGEMAYRHLPSDYLDDEEFTFFLKSIMVYLNNTMYDKLYTTIHQFRLTHDKYRKIMDNLIQIVL